MSTPQSVIHICSGVRLDSRYRNSLYFPSQTAQLSYFAGKVVKTFSAYSYLRKTWSIKVGATMEQAKQWSYLYFQNGTGYKTYFYFINQIEYINDATVELFLELDVVQTYLFDIELLPSFVERQHTSTDNLGEHTVEEGLDVGELTVNGSYNVALQDLAILMLCTINPNVTDEALVTQAMPDMYNGVFSGLKIWAVNPGNWAKWGQQLETLNEIGQIEAITAMWMYPMKLTDLGGEATWNDEDIALPVDKAVSGLMYSVPKQQSTVDGYTPKNRKLLCYPYNFLYATNNDGTHAIYRYERFDNKASTTMDFGLSGSVTPGGGAKITPIGYDGLSYHYNEGLTLTGFPTCAWDSDIYKLWLAQNQGQNTLNFLSAGLKIVGGGAVALGSTALASTGVGAVAGVAGAGTGIATAVSGVTEIANLLAQRHDKEVVPPQANGSLSSSVTITEGQFGFTFYFKSVTAETARILDNFFTMYGYKINRVQTPNIHTRENFTYVKTVGCNLKGNLCNEDMVRLESIFDNGITFWVDGDHLGNYNLSNRPLSEI